MRLIDVHCHLESAEFKDSLEGIIASARDAGLVKLITCAITPPQWEESLSLAKKHTEVECALGIHPWYASPGDFARIPELANARKLGAVAIGEIGLDRKIESPSFELQVKIFEEQLAVAREIQLPVNLHCRGAFNELILSIKRVGLPEAGGVIHAFSGSVEIAEELIKYGLSFSMGGTLTYRSSNKRKKTLSRIYPDHFMLETDSPDIPPVNMKGAPNVPANIRYCLTAAMEILGIGEKEIAETTTNNAVKMFGLRL